MVALMQWLTGFENYFRELGWLGVLLFAGAIVLVQLVAAPLSPMGMAAGLIFGFGRGFAALTLGTALGALVNFLLSRYLLRVPIARRFAKNEKFHAIDSAIGREGWKIVALLRFCPIPFGFANYCYGLTAIPLLPYLAATVFAIIPGNMFFVYLGVTAHEGLAAATGTARPRHPIEYVFLVVGLIAAFFALRHISRVARQALAAKQLEILPPP
jgi:uncharacterized membrane protein YdjX (TVP38/TMEM64 family)